MLPFAVILLLDACGQSVVVIMPLIVPLKARPDGAFLMSQDDTDTETANNMMLPRPKPHLISSCFCFLERRRYMFHS